MEITAKSSAQKQPHVLSRREAVARNFFRSVFLVRLPHLAEGAGEVPVSVAVKASYCDEGGNVWTAHTSESFELMLTASRQPGKRR